MAEQQKSQKEEQQKSKKEKEQESRGKQGNTQGDNGSHGRTGMSRARTSGMSRGHGSLDRLRDDFDRLFERLGFPTRFGEQETSWGLEMQENDESVVVRAECPGFDPDDFDVQVRGDQLVLCATHKSDEESEEGFREWSRQDFCRVISLSSAVKTEEVEAKYQNGVLTLKLPKSEESKGRKIPVKG